MAKSKLTDAQWKEVCDYYADGHTLKECEMMCGMTRFTISYQLKKRGYRVRKQLEPSRPEKAALSRNPHVRAMYDAPQEKVDATPEGPVLPPKRRIISLDGEQHQKRYERNINDRS